MLIQRVLTALLLLPLLIAVIWFAPTPWLYAIFAAAALAAAWEWSVLMGLAAPMRAAYVLATAVLFAASWRAHAQWPSFGMLLMAASALWWIVAFWLLRGFPGSFAGGLPPRWVMAAIGQILLLPTILATATLHAMPNGALRLLFVFGLVFAADTGAYLAGRNFGRHKLAPKVSPGKTLEGAIGGLALCAAWALTAGVYAFRADSAAAVLEVLLLSLVVAVVSIVGDLTESMFKRVAGLKDSGQLLPGHGGALDRVDSLMAALPMMALGLYLLRW